MVLVFLDKLIFESFNVILPTGISTILFYFPLKKNLVLSLNKYGRSPPPKDVLC